MKERLIFIQSFPERYSYNYLEEYNKENNTIEITATMKIDLNSKAAKNKLYKSWKKNKFPLLTELQEVINTNKREIKEGKRTSGIYDIEYLEKNILNKK